MAEKKSWTREERYRRYQEWDKEYMVALKEKVDHSNWRLGYHIQPNTGLLNDPNGFSFFNNQWHLFYQSYPMGAVHGLKSWYHLTSDNLVDWKDEGTKLFPDSLYDSHGVYSGSALPVKDQLFLAYTGNVRDSKWERHSYQLGAWMDKSGNIQKIDKPLVKRQPNGYTSEIRDPQVFRHKDHFLMVIGAQDEKEKGHILTYKSDDLINWECMGELSFTDQEMGFMVECPNLIVTEKTALLVFCPQGLKKETCAYDNIYPNMYVLGDSYDEQTNQLKNVTELKNLDEGFDVYATQVFEAPDKRILATSWVGLPEIEYPTDQEEWAHCLSSIKEFVIKDKKLYQQPVTEMKQLRLGEKIAFSHETKSYIETNTNQYELTISFDAQCSGALTLCTDETLNQGLVINFDTKHGKMMIDRSHAGEVFGEAFGFERHFSIEKKPLTLQLFVDSSLVELFINDGETVATMRVFPKSCQTGFHITTDGDYQGELWQLRKSHE